MLTVAAAATCFARDAAADAGDEVVPAVTPRPKRDAGETVILYFTSIGWGGSMGLFFDGLAQSDNVYARASLLSLGLVPLGAGLGAVLPTIVDLAYHRRRGVPQTIATGMLLGLGEGIAWNEFFSNRADTSFHTYTKDTAWVFGGTSAGLVAGLVTAALVKTTPGRAAWVATSGIVGGLFAGGLAGAASRPFGRDGNRNVGITAAIGGLAGMAGGIATATWLSPSELRVHLIDLGWIFGAAIPGLACINHCDTPSTFALTAIGAGVGFATMFAITSGMPKDTGKSGAPPAIVPYASPLPGGGLQLGFGGVL